MSQERYLSHTVFRFDVEDAVGDSSQDDEFGIVLLSDIAHDVLAVDRAPERVNIYEIMSKPVVAVDPDMDIRYCARLFQSLGFSYAPVIGSGEVLGVVGYRDMVLTGLAGKPRVA